MGIKRTYGKVNEKKTFFVWGENFVGGNVGPTDKLIKKKHFFVGESCWGLRQNMGKKFCVWRNLVGDNVGPTEKLIKKKHFFCKGNLVGDNVGPTEKLINKKLFFCVGESCRG